MNQGSKPPSNSPNPPKRTPVKPADGSVTNHNMAHAGPVRKSGFPEYLKNAMICGTALGAVFVGLKVWRPAPDPSKSPIAVTLDPKTGKPVAGPKDVVSAAEEKAAEPLVSESGKGADIAPEATPGPPPIPGQPTGEVSESDLMDDEAELVLTGLDSGRDKALQRDKDLFKRAITGKAWDAYRGLLARSLTVGMKELKYGQGSNRFDSVWSEHALYQAFLRWSVLGKFTQSEISETVTDTYSGEFLTWLCNNPAAMEEFLLTIKPADDAGKVLAFLSSSWPNAKDDYKDYFPLALACAVVFDKEVEIPHPVGGETGERATVAPMERFMWFVKKDKKGLLAAPVRHSSARDLVWVVCAPVSTSELDWSLDKMHLSRKNWGNAYGMVEYLMERAVNGLNPYEEYTLSEILKEGGICGDQSYFCSNTARAQGIPAMTLSGETDLGGHAWVGLKFKGDEWTTGVGRIGGVSKGQTGDPQTGEAITEQDVQSWNDRGYQSPVTTLAVGRHLWLANFFGSTGNKPGHEETVRLANQIGHGFVETWAALYALLREQTEINGDPARPNNLDQWIDFAKSMKQEFKSNPRMAKLASDAESEYIMPYGDFNDAARTLLRERRRIMRESGEQADLVAESLKREADLISKRGDTAAKEDISRLYDSALRKYGGSITGFKMMSEDYFGFFKQDPTLARKAARDIELAFKRVVETGTKDWFRANTESSIYRMICGYYRTAGDEDRAIMLEKRYEVLLERAKRGAL